MVSHQPGLPVTRMHVGDMLVAGQRMADQDGVGAVGVEFAIGLIGDLERREIDAAIEPQRLVRAELRDLRRRMIRLMRRAPRSGSPDSLSTATSTISAPASLATAGHRTEIRPIKNPA